MAAGGTGIKAGYYCYMLYHLSHGENMVEVVVVGMGGKGDGGAFIHFL